MHLPGSRTACPRWQAKQREDQVSYKASRWGTVATEISESPERPREGFMKKEALRLRNTNYGIPVEGKLLDGKEAVESRGEGGPLNPTRSAPPRVTSGRCIHWRWSSHL